MNYLITGATGLIGKKLIPQLLKSEVLIDKLPTEQTSKVAKITVLTRDKDKTDKLFAKLLLNIESRVQINTIENLTLADVNDQDVVINLAGEPIADKRWTQKQKEKICQSRWQITQKLVDLIEQAENKPSVFISGSAIGVYGRQAPLTKAKLPQKITENFSAFNQEFTHSVCKKWEDIAFTANSAETRVATLRTGIVLDPHGGALAKMLLPFRLGLGGRISCGQQVMSWIHIDDMVAAILHIINNNELSGAINLTAPNPVSNKDFSNILAKTLSRPCIMTTPAWLITLIFGEMADLLLHGQAIYPEKLINSGFVFKHATLTEALMALKLR